MRLKFLGASQQVTGSRYLLETGKIRLLIDCGLFQERNYLYRNWEACPVHPEHIDFLLLTHVHLDHSGLIPKFVREGYSNPILCTAASEELLPIMLTDSARIQEEDAAYKKKRHKREGRKGRFPEIPLYTVHDAERSFSLLKGIPYEKSLALNSHVSVRFQDAGHILGSAMLMVTVQEKSREKRLIFTGDIGQWDKPLIRDPSVFEKADFVIMESTYGTSLHEDPDKIEESLCRIINSTIAAGGNIVIPTFAVERAQELLFYLARLVRQNRIPYLMVFLDSPMAVDVTEVFQQHPECLDEETLELTQRGEPPFRFPGLRFCRSVEESKAINSIKGSCIIMAGSGMCTGGRIKHHLIQNVSHPESTILFIGYQAAGTLGRQIVDGHSQVRIHGHLRPLQARVEQLSSFSAHADRNGLLKWLLSFKSPPKHLFLTHGEKEVALKFAQFLRKEKGLKVSVPEYLEEWELK